MRYPQLMRFQGQWSDVAIHLRHHRRFLELREGQLKPFDEPRVIFVHIPKSAGVSVTRGLFGVDSVGHRTAVQYRQIYGRREFARRFAFSFVREPIDRLLSAYSYLKAGGRKDLDSWYSEFFESCSSIDEFVHDWLTRPDVQAMAHFRPQTDFLCDYRGDLIVDFIGRFERLEADYAVVAERLGQSSELPRLNIGRGERAEISPQSRDKANRFYASDFELLGYKQA